MPRSSPTIRSRLFTLVLALVVPMIAVSAGGAVLLWKLDAAATERDALHQARALSAAVARELGLAQAMLWTLASSPHLESGDLRAFHAQLQQVPRPEDARIVLSDRSGQMLVNSHVPFGTPLPRRGDLGISERVFATGRAQVSDLFRAAILDQPIIAIDVPVMRGGRVLYALDMALPATLLDRVLAQQKLPGEGAIATLVDGQRAIVARTVAIAEYLGRRLTPEMQRSIATGEAGTIRSVNLNGERVVGAFTRVPGCAWVVLLGTTEALTRVALWHSLAIVSALGGGLLLLGLLAAWYQSRRIAGAIDRLATAPVAPRGSGLREVDAAARGLAEARAVRDRAEARRAEREAQLRTVLENMPLGVLLVDAPSGRIMMRNRRAGEVLRVTPGPSAGGEACCGWEGYDPEGHRLRAEDYPLARALAGEAAPSLEIRFRRRDGSLAWYRSTAAPIRDPANGVVTGAVVALADIDAERRAVAALAESEARYRALAGSLEVRVREETEARQAAQARLAHAQHMEALGKLAGGVAHDFNNLLQAVQGSAALIRARPTEIERVRRFAGMIIAASERGSAITHRLLAFSRQEQLRAEAVDVPALLAGLREILAHTLGAGIAVRVETDSGLPPLLADKAQLETALVNLAANARDAMAGKGTLTLAAAAVTVAPDDAVAHPVALQAGAYVRLSVADTGEGMDAATLARASEPFFTTKPLGKGTGLGLAMVRGFAEQSGGGLQIDSTPGRGTVVWLWFPAGMEPAPAEAPAGLAPRRATPAPQGTARLLLVDDEAGVREVLAEQMREAGHAVLDAAEGATALALLEAGEAVDLLITDLSMPGMDGAELIRQARRRRPGLPAILLTGFATEGAGPVAQGGGDGDVVQLRKPIQAEILAGRVAALLDREPALR
ncbi:Histidine kinase [Rhodovastum atsumiense]|uniref:histidine kinase n=1 Tax=Rhodovastum atsumiense TaxID=504468 RepID=A0A5M6IWG5_9PROT|nr:ATP-binding protein [Rhodovastum atsumiense]KAA5612664.1 response regulator [Rhodovastum atsumiense]CAH2602799.1 Histidine kinase [Rhodovastum atsumiense]